jgi:hypothetical protein
MFKMLVNEPMDSFQRLDDNYIDIEEWKSLVALYSGGVGRYSLLLVAFSST